MSQFDINLIKTMLAHRYPFLLVDRVLEISNEPCSLVALKNVTANEQFFQGHFPGKPVMPGVLIVEALAQASGLMVLHHSGEASGAKDLFFLTGVDKAKFKRMVVPGDQLILKVSLEKQRGGRFFKCFGQAFVDDELACSCEISAARSADDSED
tara:strand:+ start:572 stop:1033 length:462 start_codon:yes stop_codon:yes gene_type:complete